MKKKIKNLTEEEITSLCEKHACCNNCPLEIAGFFFYCCDLRKMTEVLEKEIEL